MGNMMALSGAFWDVPFYSPYPARKSAVSLPHTSVAAPSPLRSPHASDGLYDQDETLTWDGISLEFGTNQSFPSWHCLTKVERPLWGSKTSPRLLSIEHGFPQLILDELRHCCLASDDCGLATSYLQPRVPHNHEAECPRTWRMYQQ